MGTDDAVTQRHHSDISWKAREMDERIPEDIESGHRKNPLARIHLLIGFERSRADEDKETSAGLGLFTVRERLEYFGGSLEIESESGEGSRVIPTAALTDREGSIKEGESK